MANKPFDKMNKMELVEATKFLKQDIEVAKIARDPLKPTNAEYVQVLEVYKEKQEKANPEAAIAQKVEKPAKAVSTKATQSEMKETQVKDLRTMVPVIVTDHDTSVSFENDMESRTVAIRWGNPVIGMTTVNIPLHGKMQYIQKGAIQRLRKISLASNVKDAAGKETSHRNRKRFSVSDTTGWTEEEFNAHAKEQALKRI